MFRKIVRSISNTLFRIFYRIEIINKEKINLNKKYIVCANHKTLFDVFFLSCVYTPDIYIMGKKELFKYSLFSKLFISLGALPVDRGNSDFAVLKMCLKKIKERSLVIFPEGTRNKSNKPIKAKAGLGLLSVKSKTPILPIALEYKSAFVFSKIKIHILDEVEAYNMNYEKYTTEVYEEIGNKILNDIYNKFC